MAETAEEIFDYFKPVGDRPAFCRLPDSTGRQTAARALHVYLSRCDRRPRIEVWAIRLPEPLPRVPVPLLPPDADVVLDLQAAVDAGFALVGYECLLNYRAAPPGALSVADQAWVAAHLAAQGLPA